MTKSVWEMKVTLKKAHKTTAYKLSDLILDFGLENGIFETSVTFKELKK